MARDSKYRSLDWACYVLLIVGALNWGVLGLVDVNVLEESLEVIFQPDVADFVARFIYVVVGAAGVYFLFPLYRIYRLGRSQRTS